MEGPEALQGSDGKARILIGEDQEYVADALRLLLKNEGYFIEQADSPAGVLELAGLRDFDLVLVDLNYTRDTTSGKEGLELVRNLQALDSTLPIVVMPAWGSIELAVEAMHRGARDFIQKPWSNSKLCEVARYPAAVVSYPPWRSSVESILRSAATLATAPLTSMPRCTHLNETACACSGALRCTSPSRPASPRSAGF